MITVPPRRTGWPPRSDVTTEAQGLPMPPDMVGLLAVAVCAALLITVVVCRRGLRRRQSVADLRAAVEDIKRRRTGEGLG